MRIRPAAGPDARAIATVHVQSWQATYRGIVPDAYLDALSIDQREITWGEVIERGTPEVWVADLRSVITGWVAFGASRDPDAAPSTGELEAIYVAPTHWSTRTGLALWRVARRALAERQCTSVTLWVLNDNDRATAFYLEAGFRPDPGSARAISIGGRLLTETRYAIALHGQLPTA